MKSRLTLSVVISVFSFAVISAAADTVRVIAAQAAIHLNADPNSLTLTTVQAGTVLEIDGRQDNWFVVRIPGGPSGTTRVGFLATADAQAVNDAVPRPLPAASPESSLVHTQPSRSAGDFEGFGGVTFNLPGARAVVVSPVGIADSGEHNTLPTFGLSAGAWLGDNRVSGFFFDLTGIDGGSATAQIGSSNRTNASYSAVDFHGGWQIQYPGRVRPYAQGGIGLYFQKSTGDITLLGVRVSSIDQTDHFLSFVFGAGVRFNFGAKWGLKVGVDAMSAKTTAAGYTNYGRFVAGSFYSF